MPPEGTPWWAWLTYGVLVLGLPSILVALIQQRHRVEEIKEQVKNTHTSNLREDVDVAKQQATLAAESSHRTERLAEDLIRSIRAIEHSMDRRDRLQTAANEEVRKDLDDHLSEVPRILEDAFARHSSDCPLRNPSDPD